MCSSNLQGTQVRGNRTIVASKGPISLFEQGDKCLQETIPLGISPLSIDCRKRWVNTGPNSVANSFKTLGWSSSGPKAFEGFRPFSNFVTPSLVTTMSSMNGAGSI